MLAAAAGHFCAPLRSELGAWKLAGHFFKLLVGPVCKVQGKELRRNLKGTRKDSDQIDVRPGSFLIIFLFAEALMWTPGLSAVHWIDKPDCFKKSVVAMCCAKT